jgi:hypothetical protein
MGSKEVSWRLILPRGRGGLSGLVQEFLRTLCHDACMNISQLSPLRHQAPASSPKTKPAVVTEPQLPTDQVDLRAERNAPASRRWMGAAALGALSVATMVLSGCGHQLQPEQLGAALPVQTPQQDAQQALRFEVIPNAVGKVDIIRQTHTETDTSTDTDGRSHTSTKTVDDPLQPVGVYLGQGLYLDAGLNLSLVPDRVVHAPVIPQDFNRLEIQGQLGSWSRSVVTQQGNLVTINSPLSFSHTVTRDSENQTTLQLGTFSPLQKFSRITITREGNKTTVQGWAPAGMGALSRIEITTQGNVTNVHPFGIAGLVDTRITREADKITVQPFGGSLSRSEIELNGSGQMKVTRPWSFGSQTIQRGDKGLNLSESGLGTVHSSIENQGDNYIVREPGILSTTTINVKR